MMTETNKYLVDYDELPPEDERSPGTLRGIKEEDYTDREDDSWDELYEGY